MTKHTAIYVRVSSKQQDHASQMPDLERWAAANDGAVQWYRDKFTGKTMDRPGMEKLLTDLRMGKVEGLSLAAGSVGPNDSGTLPVVDELSERKVDLVSLKDGFSPCISRWQAPRPNTGIGGRVRNRGKGRKGGSRSSRCTSQRQEVGRLQTRLAMEGVGRSGCCHSRNEDCGKEG